MESYPNINGNLSILCKVIASCIIGYVIEFSFKLTKSFQFRHFAICLWQALSSR